MLARQRKKRGLAGNITWNNPSGCIDTALLLCYDALIRQAITLISARARREVQSLSARECCGVIGIGR